jgi:hypothetical protein
MPPWGEALAELRPEQGAPAQALELLAEQALPGRARELAEAEAPKQFIVRMFKRKLRPALGAWFLNTKDRRRLTKHSGARPGARTE